jgi:CheY-like chemotaxis protein
MENGDGRHEHTLVDDDKDICASMSDIFLDLGYTVDMAYDGPDALEHSSHHQYRLALLDFKIKVRAHQTLVSVRTSVRKSVL